MGGSQGALVALKSLAGSHRRAGDRAHPTEARHCFFFPALPAGPHLLTFRFTFGSYMVDKWRLLAQLGQPRRLALHRHMEDEEVRT